MTEKSVLYLGADTTELEKNLAKGDALVAKFAKDSERSIVTSANAMQAAYAKQFGAQIQDQFNKLKPPTGKFGELAEQFDRVGRQGRIGLSSVAQLSKLVGVNIDGAVLAASELTDGVGDAVGAVGELGAAAGVVGGLVVAFGLLNSVMSERNKTISESILKHDDLVKRLQNEAKENEKLAQTIKDYADAQAKAQTGWSFDIGDVTGRFMEQDMVGRGLAEMFSLLGVRLNEVNPLFETSAQKAARLKGELEADAKEMYKFADAAYYAALNLQSALGDTRKEAIDDKRQNQQDMSEYKTAQQWGDREFVPGIGWVPKNYKEIQSKAESLANSLRSIFQRMVDAQRNAAADRIKAEEDAAARIEDINEALAERLTELAESHARDEEALAYDIAKAEQDAARDRAKIQQEYARTVKKINQDLADDLLQIQKDLQEETADIAEDLTEKSAKAKTWAEYQELVEQANDRQRDAEKKAQADRDAANKRAVDAKKEANQRRRDSLSELQQRIADQNAEFEHRRQLMEADLQRSIAKAQADAEQQRQKAYETRDAQIQAINDKLAADTAASALELQHLMDQRTAVSDLANDMRTLLGSAYDALIQKAAQLAGIPLPSPTGAHTSPLNPVPQYASGGIVPGPIGRPRLVIAHGGEPILPVDALGRPRVSLLPALLGAQMPAFAGSSRTLNFNFGAVYGVADFDYRVRQIINSHDRGH